MMRVTAYRPTESVRHYSVGLLLKLEEVACSLYTGGATKNQVNMGFKNRY
jgi:hypothetical protein